MFLCLWLLSNKRLILHGLEGKKFFKMKRLNSEKNISEILASISKNPRYENANADYLIRRLRLEFEKHALPRQCQQQTTFDRDIRQRLRQNRPKIEALGARSRRKRSIRLSGYFVTKIIYMK